MISFVEILDSSPVQAEMATIFTDIPAAKIKVDEAELAALLEKVKLAPTVDPEALYVQLMASKGARAAKDLLRGLCDIYGLAYNNHKLGNYSREDTLRMLFALFQIGPEFPRPQQAPEAERASSGQQGQPEAQDSPEKPETSEPDATVWLGQLLPDGLDEPLELPESVWSSLYGGQYPDRAVFESLNSAQSRDLLESALLGVNAPYERRILKLIPGNQVFELFERIFARPPKAGSPGVRSEPALESPGSQTAKLDWEGAQKIADSVIKEPAGSLIDVSELEIYQDLPITILDNLDMTVAPGTGLYYGCALLVNPATGRLAAFGHIETGLKRGQAAEYSPHLIFDPENLDYDAFRQQNRFNLLLFPGEAEKAFETAGTYAGKALVVPLGARYHEVPDSETVLCIDFGTSNTTAGTFGVPDDRNLNPTLVKFQDVTQDRPVLTNLLPTMVYVDSCGSGLPPVYKFGYEAKRDLIKHDYIPTASCFFEIKRWLTTMDRKEPVEDSKGRRDETVLRRDIIFAYLQYVIEAAEAQFKRRFKKLHFTAPVKQKTAFLNALEDMFAHTDKKITGFGESLDEGIAVVYHSIKKALAPEKGTPPEELDVFILDCGGGTTDLASCHCKYEKSEIFNSLRLKPGYVNGDSNFGGNNITYRVLQMLKIKIASKILKNESIDMQKLLDLDVDGILQAIDDGGDEQGANQAKKEIYRKFQEAYDEAEAVIPTKFRDYQHQREKEQVRRNFYYLWKMAEAIKIEFYKTKSNLVNLDQENPRIYAGDMENYYLMARPDGGAFVKYESPMHDVPVTFKEIERILCPDIYALLRLLLGSHPSGGKSLTDYRYRLSGQSCKIDLFHNLLKEFIPGQQLRKGHSAGDSVESTGSESLKEYCILGSIEFISDKHFGDLDLVFETAEIRHVYTVKIMVNDAGKTILAPGVGLPELGLATRPLKTKAAILKVYDSSNIQTNEISYPIANRQLVNMRLEEMLLHFKDMSAIDDVEYLRKNIFEKVENLAIENKGEFICLFALPAKKIYGFNLCQINISRAEDRLEYYIPQKAAVYSYENEELVTFFDGNR